MQSLYVIGGQQRSPRPLFADDQHWYEYRQGLIVRVDVERGRVERLVEYASPPGTRAGDDPILFKSGTLQGDRLYACTQTEVLVYALPRFELLGCVSLPCFNDLHHVRPTPDGGLLVAVSGLDMVLEMTPDGRVLREWNVL